MRLARVVLAATAWSTSTLFSSVTAHPTVGGPNVELVAAPHTAVARSTTHPHPERNDALTTRDSSSPHARPRLAPRQMETMSETVYSIRMNVPETQLRVFIMANMLPLAWQTVAATFQASVNMINSYSPFGHLPQNADYMFPAVAGNKIWLHVDEGNILDWSDITKIIAFLDQLLRVDGYELGIFDAVILPQDEGEPSLGFLLLTG